MPAQNASKTSPLSPFTLLATTTLAVTNLMVGLMQNNTFLVLASASISAALAIVYSAKIGLIPTPAKNDESSSKASADATRRQSRFPLWLFIAVLFGIMPFALLFLQFAAS